jgi:hypothetical protein
VPRRRWPISSARRALASRTVAADRWTSPRTAGPRGRRSLPGPRSATRARRPPASWSGGGGGRRCDRYGVVVLIGVTSRWAAGSAVAAARPLLLAGPSVHAEGAGLPGRMARNGLAKRDRGGGRPLRVSRGPRPQERARLPKATLRRNHRSRSVSRRSSRSTVPSIAYGERSSVTWASTNSAPTARAAAAAGATARDAGRPARGPRPGTGRWPRRSQGA